jgi:hypothetical protein
MCVYVCEHARACVPHLCQCLLQHGQTYIARVGSTHAHVHIKHRIDSRPTVLHMKGALGAAWKQRAQLGCGLMG